ncbi:D-glycerate dehydrogenase [Undibacterium cyanobacteriorum]|uniref:D-glycerate dehydrogenase n=1 Tax=Undibacterium cyanobacteriorum TaxID=3073561 RepID=A0ABY9RPR2_9BURK|nr:D-glycerate dehydrogenase [Undibacterium sp. 20NA77.5]WMW82255.1 D-glycerate dehydrogenase [Undibacterium sp. 20NA77.5]
MLNAQSKPNLLVARAIFPEILEKLSDYFVLETNQEDRIFPSQELVQRLQGKFGMLCTSSAKVNSELLNACPELRIVSTLAVGYDNFDLAACSEAGVLATNAPDVLNETTADFAWALLMAAARRVTESEHWLRAGKWEKWSIDCFLGADLHGSTLGILGMGRIGQAVARRSIGFGMKVIYHNRSRLGPEIEDASNNAEYVSKQDLFAQADHLVIVVPYSPEAHHLVGAGELAMMKPSACLVNVARGGIVDDVALIAALKEKKIAAAGLDVFENEPRFHPDFLELENVVLTPHIASASRKTRLAMAHRAADNLIAAVSGRMPLDLLNSASLRKSALSL